jgi:hypothetical protein
VSYDGVKIVCPSFIDATRLKEFKIEGHGGVEFLKWDIPNAKLYLQAYARDSSHNWEWDSIVYDLKTNRVTVGPRRTF